MYSIRKIMDLNIVQHADTCKIPEPLSKQHEPPGDYLKTITGLATGCPSSLVLGFLSAGGFFKNVKCVPCRELSDSRKFPTCQCQDIL